MVHLFLTIDLWTFNTANHKNCTLISFLSRLANYSTFRSSQTKDSPHSPAPFAWHVTYLGIGKHGNGPMIEKLIIFSAHPKMSIVFALINLSTILPKMGDTIAYVPPLIMNMNPVNTGERPNCKKVKSQYLHCTKRADCDEVYSPLWCVAPKLRYRIRNWSQIQWHLSRLAQWRGFWTQLLMLLWNQRVLKRGQCQEVA